VNFSPGVEEFGVSVVDRDLPFERFHELHFGSGEAEAVPLGRDLETAAVPLHDVVVADRALVLKAADTFQVLGSGTPSCLAEGVRNRRSAAPAMDPAWANSTSARKSSSTGAS